MNNFPLISILRILLLTLITNSSLSALHAKEGEFNCNFQWNNIGNFLVLSKNGDTLVCLLQTENSAVLSVQSLSTKTSTTQNITIPNGLEDYLDNIKIGNISHDGRYLALYKTGFVSGAGKPSGEYKSFAQYLIVDLKSGSIENISKRFPKECNSKVGKFSSDSQFFVFGVGSSSFIVDPERKKTTRAWRL